MPLIDTIERALYWVTSFVLHADVDAHVLPVAPLDDTTLITCNNSLMSVIELRGVKKLQGASEFEIAAGAMGGVLSKLMKAGNGRQHSFALGFKSNPDGAPRVIIEALGPAMETARRLGVEDLSVLRSQVQTLAARCVEESCYLVVYTNPSGLSQSDRERAVRQTEETHAKLSKEVPDRRVDSTVSQAIKIPATALIARHSAAVDSVVHEIMGEPSRGGVGLLAERMEASRALSLMRRHLEASQFPSSWRPRLLGGPSASRPSLIAQRGKESTHRLPMTISRQVISEGFEDIFDDVEMARQRDTYYAGLILEVPPEDGSVPFADLAQRIGRRIPLTINFEIVPNGETDIRGMDRLYAGVLGAVGEYNKRVRQGWEALRDLRRSGVYIAGMRAVFLTWGASKREAIDNLSFLRSSMESWGSAVVSNETGSPTLLAMSASAGLLRRMPAPYLPGPINEFSRMMPVYRPASVWDAGQLIAHTSDGRVYPVAFGSPLQAFWGTLIFAPSGSGKSFLLNMITMGILMSPGLEDIPYVTIIDVGPSLRLVMDVVRAMLPEHRRRQIVSMRIRNHPDYAVNPFDTQLGCDRPTAVDRDFQVAVVSTVCQNLGPEGERFIGQVIDAAYKTFSRTSTEQRRWQGSLDDRVSAVLKDIGFAVTEYTFVWEVVDALFAAGRPDDAIMAQRYAVPRLVDLIKACRQQDILDSYRNVPTPTGELLIDVFTRSIQTAQSEYELISGYTRFDVGPARAIAIDLEEVVTGDESAEGRARAALMFMFGRRLGARNYFLRWEEIEKLVPPMYADYQRKRILGIEESLKFLIYDEVHYAGGMPAAMGRINKDLRVGRKYKMVTMMSSQMLSDFPHASVENCYTYFILGSGTDTSLDQLQKTFGLSDSEIKAVRTECVAPGTLFGLFKTKQGQTSQILKTAASPIMTWAFNTDKDDAMVRSATVEKLGGDLLLALRKLATAFPKGSARDEMMIHRRRLGSKGLSDESLPDQFAQKAADTDAAEIELPKFVA